MALQQREYVEKLEDTFNENQITHVEKLEDTFNENQITHVVHQRRSSEMITSIAKMKKGIDETVKAMENAHDVTYEMEVSTDEMKIKLSRKNDEMEKLEEKLEETKKQAELDNRKVSELKIEVNKISIAIEKIKEIGQSLDQKYLERSQNDLVNNLVKITSEAEKAQSNLNVTKKIEEITAKKLESIEIDFNRLKKYTLNRISETEKIIHQVDTATQHIIKSYDEITTVSKDLFKSATSTHIELKEGGNYDLEEMQVR
jgi:chromosome segregation ATPase